MFDIRADLCLCWLRSDLRKTLDRLASPACSDIVLKFFQRGRERAGGIVEGNGQKETTPRRSILGHVRYSAKNRIHNYWDGDDILQHERGNTDELQRLLCRTPNQPSHLLLVSYLYP